MDVFDAAWSLMEIMGVGMVDMKMWKWLYNNPEATPAQLKEGVLSIAVETWNKYFTFRSLVQATRQYLPFIPT